MKTTDCVLVSSLPTFSFKTIPHTGRGFKELDKATKCKTLYSKWIFVMYLHISFLRVNTWKKIKTHCTN